MATNRDYTEDFEHNVDVSLEAEQIAQELLEQLTWDQFTSVRDNPAYYHIGDLLDSHGKSYDVKDDGVVHATHNVFCETKKRWKSDGSRTDGWMLNSQYDYLVVLDRVGRHIYLLDFPELKKIYNRCGKPVYNVDMGDNYTNGFVVSLNKCRQFGVMVDESEYVVEADGSVNLII